MKIYPPSWHGDLMLANIETVAAMFRTVLEGETFSTVEVGRLDRPQVETRQQLSMAITFHATPIFVSLDEQIGWLTISTAQQNWAFKTGMTQIVYQRGREIYFVTQPFHIQIVFKLDEAALEPAV